MAATHGNSNLLGVEVDVGLVVGVVDPAELGHGTGSADGDVVGVV